MTGINSYSDNFEIDLQRFQMFARKSLVSNEVDANGVRMILSTIRIFEGKIMSSKNSLSDVQLDEWRKQKSEIERLVKSCQSLRETKIKDQEENCHRVSPSVSTEVSKETGNPMNPSHGRERIGSTSQSTNITSKDVVREEMEAKERERERERGQDTHTTSGERIHELLQKQKDLATQEIERERREQAILSSELSELTNILRESSLHISEAVLAQNKSLMMIKDHAASNVEELLTQKKKMNEREKAATESFWTSFGAMIW
eukprot:CAMPEP_0182429958 /NCGR_PEP_ID=MMETSP1167-20130531/35514_1 /TAXON_ID=2988 /ORGANISM="Mallomonas Sp, Strain CCMP3275" /LENGTH=259 /DNA_ID=CAMNT_0024614425 /DNA_START=53 /DNA_END=829 /DNA_ORIENTATION=+